MGFGGRLEVGPSRTDGRIEVVIRGNDEHILAGELAGLVEWIEVTGPPGVRDHLASIGNALVERYGSNRQGRRTAAVSEDAARHRRP
ncbi:DeoR family transcriptional regulator [Micromonospora maris AB-18-032]|nr:DeoR family transcriptional regulator [Micromonospora maris AB-18-032]